MILLFILLENGLINLEMYESSSVFSIVPHYILRAILESFVAFGLELSILESFLESSRQLVFW